MKALRLLALLLCSLAPLLRAQDGLTRLGEFKVNTTTSGDQRSASVASAPDGRFVVAWTNAPDSGIYFQRYNAAGSPVGAETKANTNPARVPDSPSVGMDQNGNFIVVWVKATDGDGNGIAAQRFNSDGQPIGVGGTVGAAEFRVNTDISYDQTAPDVAMGDGGEFAVCWHTYLYGVPSPHYRAYVQFYSSSGSAVGGQVSLNPSNVYDRDPAIGKRPGGGFGVVWRQSPGTGDDNIKLRLFAADGTVEQSGSTLSVSDGVLNGAAIAFAADGTIVVSYFTLTGDASGRAVFAQRMSSAGAKVGVPFLINKAEGGDQSDPTVVFDSPTTFVVGYRSVGFDGSGNAFAARRFNFADASEATPEFLVNTFTSGDQTPLQLEHTIAADSAGNLVFVWTSDAQDGSGGGIYAEKFYQPNQGPPLSEFRVNRDTAGSQTTPTVATNGAGQFVVAWASGSPSDIVAQRYTSDGRRAGNPFPVNPPRGFGDTANRERPTIAMDGSGRFVIAWLQDAGNFGYGDIWLQAFDAVGQPQGGPFIPYGSAQNKQSDPAVAMTADGAFIVTWSIVEGAAGNNTGSIRAKRYMLQAGQGPLAGSEFPVTDPGPGADPRIPRVALASDGRATISWSNFLGDDRRVFFRIFDSGSTTPLTVDSDRVNDASNRRQTAPDVVTLEDGSFFIGWDDAATEASPHHPRFRKFSRDGEGIAGLAETRIPDQATDDSRPAAQSLATDSLGNVLAVWTRSETIGAGLAYRLFNSNGTPTEAPDGFDLAVNQTVDGDQESSNRNMIASVGPGKFVVVWQSTVGDGDGTGIYAAVLDLLGVTEPMVTTGDATNKTANTATLNGTVTPNDFAVGVSFELAESEAALGTGSATTVPAVPPTLAAGLTTPQAVTKDFTGLTLGIGGVPKTYYYRTKATPMGNAPIYGETVPFTVQNTPPVAADDAFVILGNESLKVLLNDTDADGDALRIVSVTAPTGLSGAPEISTGFDQISCNPNDLFPDALDGDSFTYTISDRASGGLTSTATVNVFSVKVLAGLYAGLIGGDDAGADAAGRLDITITATGVVTGSFKWQGRPYPFKDARLGTDGTLTTTRKKIGPDGKEIPGVQLELTLTLDPVTRILTGTLTDTETDPDTVVQAELTGTVTADQVATLPEAGTFNAVIDTGTTALPESAAPEAGATLLPRGVGFAQITVKKSRNKRPARFVGRMPDDQPFSSGARALVQALRAAAGARYPLFVDNLYPKTRDLEGRFQNGGVVSSNVGFTKATERFDAGLNWERRANESAPVFPMGFRTGLAAFRATLLAIKYGRPAPGGLPAGIQTFADPDTLNARIEFADGDLTNRLLRKLRLSRAGNGPVRTRLGAPEPVNNAAVVTLRVNANKGVFNGTFIHPADAAQPKPPRTKFNGVFQGQDGQGTFTGPTNTGRIQILAQ